MTGKPMIFKYSMITVHNKHDDIEYASTDPITYEELKEVIVKKVLPYALSDDFRFPVSNLVISDKHMAFIEDVIIQTTCMESRSKQRKYEKSIRWGSRGNPYEEMLEKIAGHRTQDLVTVIKFHKPRGYKSLGDALEKMVKDLASGNF